MQYAPIISILISSLALVGGLISHFFVVTKEITVLKTEMKHAKEDIVSLKEHLPKIEEKLNSSNALLSGITSKLEILTRQ